MCLVITVSYGWSDAALPRWARHFCHAQLAEALPDVPTRRALAELTGLVISELVTNAVNAGTDEVTITLALHRDHIRLLVRDDAGGTPRPRAAAPVEANGRGLAIVDAVALDWGVEPGPSGKVVWADLAVVEPLTGLVPCALEPV